MAVVQISKIQVRRGQKNSNSGIPQLSSAEFAWAVDSQELFIGNGSVAEGAPYVGNTKILTEHDNILDLASSYQFASNDTSITLSVPRDLQGKLDEYVSVTDFGAVGDGSTDCVSAFQTAFTELFRNVNPNYKKVLVVPNGEYLFSSDLAIPSNVILKGETAKGAVLNIGDNNIRFITSTGLELADFSSTNRPRNIEISDLTIKRVTGQVTLSGIKDSIIEGVIFQGEYNLGNSVPSLTTEPAAVFWENNLAGIKVDNIQFKYCLFESNSVAVKCSQTSVFDTSVYFDRCKIFVSNTGIYINGLASQGNNWVISDCEFEEITDQAFRSTNGQGTLILRSKFKNVGNDTGTASYPTGPMVYFGEIVGNVIDRCISNRQQNGGLTSTTSTAFYPEVYNGSKVSFVDRNYSNIYLSDSFIPIAVLSANNRFHEINYTLRLGAHSRTGTLYLSVGEDLAGAEEVTPISITDNYQYSPRFTSSEGGALMTNFEFNAELKDNDADSGIETIVLSYKNPLANGKTGSISFDVTYGV